MFMSDHRQVLSKLQGVARSVKVTLPTSPNAMQKRMARKEMNASGPAFDKLYIHNEIMGHQMSITQTRQEIRSGSNQQVLRRAKVSGLCFV
jgi:predicted outer membrane protein